MLDDGFGAVGNTGVDRVNTQALQAATGQPGADDDQVPELSMLDDKQPAWRLNIEPRKSSSSIKALDPGWCFHAEKAAFRFRVFLPCIVDKPKRNGFALMTQDPANR